MSGSPILTHRFRKLVTVLPLAGVLICSNVFAVTGHHVGPRVTRRSRLQQPPVPATPLPGGGVDTSDPGSSRSDLVLFVPQAVETASCSAHSQPLASGSLVPRVSSTHFAAATLPVSALRRDTIMATAHRFHGALSVGFDGESGLQAEAGYTLRLR